MFSIYLCISFGYGDEAEVWAANITSERLLQLGEAATINLATESGKEISVASEIIFVGETEDGNNYAVAVSDQAIEDEAFRDALIFSEWSLLSGEEAEDVIDLVDFSPPVAALQDLLLVVGDYTSKDEFGYPDKIQVWHRVLEPSDVSVPLFGEKFFSHVLLSNQEFSDEPYDSDRVTLEEGVSLSDLFEGDSKLRHNGEIPEESLDEDHTVIYVEEPPVDINEEGTPEGGYPVITFFTAKKDYGMASLGIWSPNMSPYTEFDLVADGWEQLGEESFNPIDFRLEERITLAMQTNLILSYDDEGNRFISQYSLQNPEAVTAEQFDLIPIALQEFAEGVREISNELDDIDNVIGEWMLEDSEEGTGKS